MSRGFPASLSEMREIGATLSDSESDWDTVAAGADAVGSFVDLPGSFFVGFFEAELVVFVGDAFFLLSTDRMVGGSCIGSPARISFFALKIGTQQT